MQENNQYKNIHNCFYHIYLCNISFKSTVSQNLPRFIFTHAPSKIYETDAARIYEKGVKKRRL